MKKLLSLGLIAAFIGFQGCSTDFEVTGDYTEFSVVYGLLDVNNNPSNGGTGHNIRVQKAFLGEIDAAIMASTPDSSYFPVEDLMVTLTEYDAEGDAKNHFVLSDIMIDGKDTTGGYGFFGPDQRVYHTDENLVGGFDYELLVHNTHTGYRDSATVKLLDPEDVRFLAPNAGQSQRITFQPYNPVTEYRPTTFRFNNPLGVKTGELWLRLHYREMLNSNPGTVTAKFVDLKVAGFTFDDEDDLNQFQFALDGESFYRSVANALDPIAGQRTIGLQEHTNGFSDDLQLYVYIGGVDLYDYISINAPSTSGALTDNISYSNMSVGKGMFSSRSQIFNDAFLQLNTVASAELAGGTFTRDLSFID
ncbi:MAG: hypothetical protein ACI9FU_000799 [Granulosicoccus sp.]|jgi:hypothetical protein